MLVASSSVRAVDIVDRKRYQMTALSSVAWQQGQNKPAVVGMLPVWHISRPGCKKWVMGTEALKCWSFLLLHTSAALRVGSKIHWLHAKTHMQINHVDKNKTLTTWWYRYWINDYKTGLY